MGAMASRRYCLGIASMALTGFLESHRGIAGMPLVRPKLDHRPCAPIWPLILAQPIVRPGGRITVKFVLRYGLGALWGVC